jgi:hypothetical protein
VIWWVTPVCRDEDPEAQLGARTNDWHEQLLGLVSSARVGFEIPAEENNWDSWQTRIILLTLRDIEPRAMQSETTRAAGWKLEAVGGDIAVVAAKQAAWKLLEVHDYSQHNSYYSIGAQQP